MKKNKTGDTIKGLILLGIIAIIVIIAIRKIFDFVVAAISKIGQLTSNMDAVVIVALITGTVSILGVVLSSFGGKVLEYRQATKRYLYEKREQPYSEFIEMVYTIMQSTKKGTDYSEEMMLEDMLHFSQLLTLWGSSRVIKKWLKFRELSQTPNNKPIDNLFILEDIIFEIRRDMGLSKQGLKQGDMLAFFVNDIRKYLPDKRNTSGK